MKTPSILIIAAVSLLFTHTAQLDAQTLSSNEQQLGQRIAQVEQRITQTDQRVANLNSEFASMRNGGGATAVLFLFGAFCALWAQNTGRSAWFWFFMGLLFNVIAVIVLLVKNSNDRSTRDYEQRMRRGFGHA